jgi:hypothetical protein
VLFVSDGGVYRSKLPGRLVDNLGFFKVPAIDQVPDGALYGMLLSESPRWFQGARSAGVVR